MSSGDIIVMGNWIMIQLLVAISHMPPAQQEGDQRLNLAQIDSLGQLITAKYIFDDFRLMCMCGYWQLVVAYLISQCIIILIYSA